MKNNIWRLLPLERHNAFYNMAVDEAILLSHSKKKTPPTLRFYTWNTPSISFGYFQKITEEKKRWQKLHIPFVRRLSGGKAVYHNYDLTYSLIVREDLNVLPKNISRSCQKIGECLYQGLKLYGLPVGSLEINSKKLIRKQNKEYRIQDKRRKTQKNDMNCFKYFSEGEILFNQRKLVGSAQVRKNRTILQHGSLLMNELPLWDKKNTNDHKIINLKEILGRKVSYKETVPFLVSGFESVFNITFETGCLTDEEKKMAKELEKKYKQEV